MMMGEPIVKKEMYINHIRILEEAMPSLSPIAVHTPKACNSKVSRILYIQMCCLPGKNF
jgi:hypothetical protein